MFSVDRLGGVVVALLLVTSAAVAPTAATDTYPARGGTTGGGDQVVPAAEAPPANNTTQHRDPETVAEDGDLQGVERWLGGRMGRLLGESTLQLSQEEYEAARRVVGDGYDDHLERYVDVAGDTGTNDDDERVETYEETQETQKEYVDAVETYREQREAYEAAREGGNEEEARRIARNLTRTADRVQTLSESLTSGYAEIESDTGIDLQDATARVESISANITAEADQIRATTLVATDLELSQVANRATFTEPLLVRGTVAAENGSVEEGVVVLRLGPQTVRAPIADDGSFDLSLRPTLAPVGEQTVRVMYVPPSSSQWLSANESMTVEVIPTTPDLDLDVPTRTLRYGDQIEVAANLSIDETGVSAIPLRIRLGDRALFSGETAEDGRLSATARVPARVEAGERSLTARVVLADRAIASTDAAAMVTIAASETTLALDTGADRVDGRLETVNGTPVAGLPVSVEVDGETRVVETDDDGAFTVALPVVEQSNQSATFSASFDGAGTNLESSSASTMVILPQSDDGPGSDESDGDSGDAGSPVVLIVGGITVLLLVLVGAGLWYLRRIGDAEPHTSAGTESTSDQATGLQTGTSGSVERDPPERDPFADAESVLADGRPTTAVLVCYPALRAALKTDEDDTRTHWEFFDAVTARHHESASGLRAVTVAYERAAFADESLTREAAEEVLAEARDVLENVGAADTTATAGDD